MGSLKARKRKLFDRSCDQCQALFINGIYCHEIGCPNMRKVKVDGGWIAPEPEESEDE